MSGLAAQLFTWGRWPALVVLGLLGLAIVYRVVPERTPPKWRWVTPGSVLAVFLWLAVSALFSIYASSYGNFGTTYGPLAGVIVLLLWLYLSAFAILLGAELEAQTKKDSTVAPEKSMGTRGAKKADTLGEARSGTE